MAQRRTRNLRMGPARRILYPVETVLNTLTRVSGRVLNTGKKVITNVGNGARCVVSNTTSAINDTGRVMLLGKKKRMTRRK